MYKCPIDYYTDNLIFNADKSCWAGFKLGGFDYDYLGTEGKINILNKLIRLFVGILSEAQILIVPTEQNTTEHFKNLKNRVSKNDILYHVAMEQAQKTEDYLKQSVACQGAVNDYKTYLLLKLDEHVEYKVVTQIQEAVQYFLKNPINSINVQMNLDTKDILSSKVEAYEKLSNDWFKTNNHKIKMLKMNETEIQWIFRRMSYRGTGKEVQLFYASMERAPWKPKAEVVELENEKILRPFKRDIVNLFSGTIEREQRCLKVTTDKTTSFQSFLVVTGLPEVTSFPGCEWLYMLQQYNTQAEVCIHIKAIPHKSGLHKLELKKREINSQMEHIETARAEVPEDVLEAKEYADIMESELKNTKSPLLQTTVSICLAAEDKDTLEERCNIIREAYEGMNFVIERPLTDQMKLFMQFIPSVGTLIKDFILPVTPKTLAAGIIGATHELGDNIGPYIGTTGEEEKHVFLDLGQACLENKSPAATFFGNLGVGKSFNANTLLYSNIIYGGYGLIFDPKGERTHWVTDLPALRGLITMVTLGTEERYKGMLDPYNIYRNDLRLANSLAVSMVSELFKVNPRSDDYMALLEATKKIGESSTPPSMLKLAQILNDFDENDELKSNARSLARNIRLQQDNGMAQLLFGDGSEESIKLDNRLNIIQIENLRLPSPETKSEDYTTDEIISTVIMMVLGQFAKLFALEKRPVFKIILFDESWSLGKTREGQKLYEFLSRMGRSLYTGVIYNGHSVLDIPTEGIKNTITYKFCFQTTNPSEVERMLKYLGIEDIPENREILKSLRNGECLFQDLNGRVGKLKFDAVFQDLIEVFSTTPKTNDSTLKLADNLAMDDQTENRIHDDDNWPEEDLTESLNDLVTADPEEDEIYGDNNWPEEDLTEEIDIYAREVI